MQTETTITNTPRIYAASLSDYNAGRLVGEWIDATDADEIAEGVAAMLKAAGPGREEYAIHDYDNFEGIRLGEYESFEKVAAIGAALLEHGEVFAVWHGIADTHGTEPADLAEQFQGEYMGTYDSPEDYAREYLAESGLLADANDDLARYFDYAAYAHDMDCGGYTFERWADGVAVFLP